MKKFAYIYYVLFLFFLFIVGLLSGEFKVKADELTSWSTQQTRVQTTHDGTDTWSSFYNIPGNEPYVFNSSVLTYPVNAIAWQVKSNNGLNRENSYTFQFGYKATPDSLRVQSYYIQNSSTGEQEEITCTNFTSSSNYNWYTCTFTPKNTYTSSQTMYIKMNFYSSYLTELRVVIRGFEERKGTNAVITEQTNNIINNDNQNTQNIINNNNQNTQEIINNQNTNTQEQINSQKVCTTLSLSRNSKIALDNASLNGSGSEITISRTNYFITDYYNINSESIITQTRQLGTTNYMCFYDDNLTLISCQQAITNSSNIPSIITIPNNAKKVRFTLSKNLAMVLYSIKTCDNGNQQLSDGIHDLNDTLNNDNVDEPSSSISDMEDLLPTNGVITQLIALPITLYQKVLNSINGTCSQFNLGSLYGTNLIIPCIDVSEYLGSSIWNTIDLIISGAFVLIIARKMIKAFENFTSMKEGDVIND